MSTSIGTPDEFHPNFHRKTLGLSKGFTSLARSFALHYQMMTQRSHDPGLKLGFGVANPVLGMVTNSLALQGVTEDVERAQKIQDIAGLQLAQIRQVATSFSLSSVLVQGTLQGFSMASLYITAKSVVLSIKYLGYSVTGLGSVIYTLIMIPPAISATKQIYFSQQLKAQRDVGWGLQFLVDQWKLTAEEREEALTTFSQEESEDLLPEEMARLTEEDRGFLERVDEGLRSSLAKELIRKMEVKEAELKRNTGSDTVALIREEVYSPGTRTAEEIIGLALEENRSKIILNICVVSAALIGLVGLVTVSVFTAGIPLYIGLATMICSDLFLFGLDVHTFIQEVGSLKAAPKDRLLMLIISAISILAVALGAFLAVGPLAKLIVILIGLFFTGIQLGILGWAWYNYENERGNFSTA
jgi:hypothetical protein